MEIMLASNEISVFYHLRVAKAEKRILAALTSNTLYGGEPEAATTQKY